MDLDAPSRDALANALRSVRESAGISQKELDRLTGGQVDQSKLSKYERGVNEPPLGSLLAIDEALGNPRGTILGLAGLIERGVTTEEAIRSDPDLPSEVAQGLLTFYQLGKEAAPSRDAAAARTRERMRADRAAASAAPPAGERKGRTRRRAG